MTSRIVVSLFDFTGEAVRPWAEERYACLCFDLQHGTEPRTVTFTGGGSITFLHWNSDTPDAAAVVSAAVGARTVAFLFGFPPCTDLAGSGAKHWKKKNLADPQFQERAAARATLCATIADTLRCPYAIENPRGALSRLWRKPDATFSPCDFGGYIAAADAAHPTWPEYIPPLDAYTKATNLWTGGGFRMPAPIKVEPIIVEYPNGKRGSPQWAKLGGSSLKTKNIRSATPRGFARAVFAANSVA